MTWVLPMLALAAATASAADPPTVQQLLPFDAGACFVRDYDAAHRAKHPAQRIAGLQLGMRAGWNVGEGRDRPYHELFVSLTVATRDGEAWSTLGYCSDYEASNESGAPPGLACDLPCNGDRFRLQAVDADTLLLSSDGLRARCDAERIDDADSTAFRLLRRPDEACIRLGQLPAAEAQIQALYTRLRGEAD